MCPGRSYIMRRGLSSLHDGGWSHHQIVELSCRLFLEVVVHAGIDGSWGRAWSLLPEAHPNVEGRQLGRFIFFPPWLFFSFVLFRGIDSSPCVVVVVSWRHSKKKRWPDCFEFRGDSHQWMFHRTQRNRWTPLGAPKTAATSVLLQLRHVPSPSWHFYHLFTPTPHARSPEPTA